MGRPNTLVFSSQRLNPSSLIDSTYKDNIFNFTFDTIPSTQMINIINKCTIYTC